MKKFFPILLSTVLLLSSCGRSSDSASSSGGAFPSMDKAESSFAESQSSGSMSPESSESNTFLSTNEIAPAKLVYSGWMELETIDFDLVLEEIDALVSTHDGYFGEKNLYHYGATRHGSYTIRVPQEKYESFMLELGALCQVLHTSTTIEDISSQYYDTQGRLETQEAKMDRLQEMFAQAETMDDLISLETAISETQWMIDSLSGMMKEFNSLVDYATLDLSLQEVVKLSHMEETSTGFFQRLMSSFSKGGADFVDRTADYLLYLAYNWVVLLFITVGIVVFILFWKKKKLPKLGKLRKEKNKKE
ncbi:MAG: DUF4349 domain-containing protein [Eubacteriales bacterium]